MYSPLRTHRVAFFAAVLCACNAGQALNAAAPGPASGAMAGSAGASAAIRGSAGALAAMRVSVAPSNPDSLYDVTSGELRAPEAGAGVQITTPAFDLPPGAEVYACYHTEIAHDGEIDVRYYESKMETGSHHFILYKMDDDQAPLESLDPIWCIGDFDHQNWIYSASQPHIDLQIPEGVAIQLKPRQRVMLDMHYINVTDSTLKAQVRLNMTFAQGAFQSAATLVSYNNDIKLPPNGTQTVGNECTPGPDAKFFYMLTHTHRHGVLASVHRVLSDGSLGEELLHTTDWEQPQQGKWLHEPFLTFQPGERVRIDCSYRNDSNQTITTGPSAIANEMCMMISYYQPASAGGSCH